MNQSKLEANTCSRHEARENVRERVMIGFGFSSDWLRKWRKIFEPITKRSNAKPKQTQLTFDTQVKTALTRTKSHFPWICFSHSNTAILLLISQIELPFS